MSRPEQIHRTSAVVEILAREVESIEEYAIDGIASDGSDDRIDQIGRRRRIERRDVQAVDAVSIGTRPSRNLSEIRGAPHVDCEHLGRELTWHHQPFGMLVDHVLAGWRDFSNR